MTRARFVVVLAALLATGCGLFGKKDEPTGNPCVDDPTRTITIRPPTATMKPGQRTTFDYEIRSEKGGATATPSVTAGALEPAGQSAVWWTAPPLPGTYTLTVTRDGCPADTGTATLTVTPLDDPGPAPGVQPSPTGVAFSPDGRLVAAAARGGVWLFRADGTFVDSLKLQHQGPMSVAFSPDGQTLAVAGDQNERAVLVKVDGMAPITTLGLHAAGGVVFSEDGQTVYLNERDQLTKVDLSTGQGAVVSPLRVPPTPSTAPHRVALGPLGSLVATPPGELREVATGRLMARWAANAVVLAKDASWLLGPGGLSFPFFPGPATGGGASFRSAALSHSGDLVALGFDDGTVQVVRVANGALAPVSTYTLPNAAGPVHDLAWNSDDSALAIAGTPRLVIATRAQLGLP